MTQFKRALEDLEGETRYSVRIRAISRFNVVSEWSEVLEFVTPESNFQLTAQGSSESIFISALFNQFIPGETTRTLNLVPSNLWPQQNIDLNSMEDTQEMSLENWELPNFSDIDLYPETDQAFYHERTVYWFSETEYIAFNFTSQGFLFEVWEIQSPLNHIRQHVHNEPLPAGLSLFFIGGDHAWSNFVPTSDPNIVFVVATSRWSSGDRVENAVRMLGFYATRDGSVFAAGEVNYATSSMVNEIHDDSPGSSSSQENQGRHWLEPTSNPDVIVGTTGIEARGTSPQTEWKTYLFFYSLILDTNAKTFSRGDSEMLVGHTYGDDVTPVEIFGARGGHCFTVVDSTAYRLQFFRPQSAAGASCYVESCDINPTSGVISNLQRVKRTNLFETLFQERPDIGIAWGLGSGFATGDGGMNDYKTRSVMLSDGRVLMHIMLEYYWNGVIEDIQVTNPLFGPVPDSNIAEHQWVDRAHFFFILDTSDLTLEWGGWDSYHVRPEIPNVSDEPAASASSPGIRIVDNNLVVWTSRPTVVVAQGVWTDWVPGPYFVSTIDISELHQPGVYIPQGTTTTQINHWPGWAFDSPVAGNPEGIVETDPISTSISPLGFHLVAETAGITYDFATWYGALVTMGVEGSILQSNLETNKHGVGSVEVQWEWVGFADMSDNILELQTYENGMESISIEKFVGVQGIKVVPLFYHPNHTWQLNATNNSGVNTELFGSITHEGVTVQSFDVIQES